MKFFIDTEFIEGVRKPLFRNKSHFIDLISIGIVAEDGRTYYAINNQFEPDDADGWVKDNVLYQIMRQNGYDKPLSNLHGCLSYNRRAVKNIQKHIGKHPAVIAMEIVDFVSRDESDKELGRHVNIEKEPPEFYGYYSDYDWVVFCSLFGRMIDLPKGFPMYCRDLKQDFDDVQNLSKYDLKQQPNYPKQENKHNALDDAKWNFKLFKFIQQCRV